MNVLDEIFGEGFVEAMWGADSLLLREGHAQIIAKRNASLTPAIMRQELADLGRRIEAAREGGEK